MALAIVVGLAVDRDDVVPPPDLGRAVGIAIERDAGDLVDKIDRDLHGQPVAARLERQAVHAELRPFTHDIEAQPAARRDRQRGACRQGRQDGQHRAAREKPAPFDHAASSRTYRPTSIVPVRKPASQ